MVKAGEEKRDRQRKEKREGGTEWRNGSKGMTVRDMERKKGAGVEATDLVLSGM